MRTADRAGAAPRRWARRVALALAAAAALGPLLAGPASAHASLVSSTPVDGSGGPVAPTSVSAAFDEPVLIDPGSLRVFGPAGRLVDTGPASHGPGGDTRLTVHLPAGLGPGTYTAAWRVVSADSHPVHGAFTFWVGTPGGRAPAVAAGAASRALGVGYGVLRWLGFGAFALLVGAGAFTVCCWPAGVGRRRVRWLLVGGWIGLLLASLGTLLVQGPYAQGVGLAAALDPVLLRETLGSRLGTALIARVLLLGLVAGYLAWLLGRVGTAAGRERRALGLAGGALAVALALTWSAADHAAAGRQSPLAIPVDVAHLLAMGVWAGGLAVLALALLRPRPRSSDVPSDAASAPDTATTELTTATSRFSRIALACVATLALTGAYQGWRQVGEWGALGGTSYGRLLAFKVGLVTVLVGLGWVARDWVRRQANGPAARSGQGPAVADVRALRRSVGAEAGLAALVLAVTALLVDAAPARVAYTVPVNARVSYDAGGADGAGTLALTLEPARTGANMMHIRLLGADGRPRSAPEVRAAMSLPSRGIGPLPITLTPAAPGVYHAPGLVAPIAGRWRVDVTVRTSAIDETTVSVPATIR